MVAIGSPFGLDQTVTSGIVSALNVSHPKIEGFQSFIQTDAPINPGNSGGPLINNQGQVVGINTAILGPGANIGIGFAIPSNMVQSVAEQLIKYHQVQRGALGVVGQTLNPQLKKALNITPDTRGVLVSQVVPGSPAQQAGLLLQDVILRVNQKPITSADQLRNMLGLMRPGTALSLTIQREQKQRTLHAKVTSPLKLSQQTTVPFIGGEHLRNFSEITSDGKSLTGVMITALNPVSAGALAGLSVGDVIIKANGKAVTNTEQLQSIVQHDRNQEQMLFLVQRHGMNAYVVVQRQS